MQKVYKGRERNSMRTSAQVSGRRFESKGTKKRL